MAFVTKAHTELTGVWSIFDLSEAVVVVGLFRMHIVLLVGILVVIMLRQFSDRSGL